MKKIYHSTLQTLTPYMRKYLLRSEPVLMSMLFLGLLGVAWTIVSCIVRIPPGAVGIVQNVDGSFKRNKVILPGLYFSFPYKYIPIDADLLSLPVKNLHPKDINGATLDNLSLNINYQLVPTKIPGFFTYSHDLQTDVDGRVIIGRNLFSNSIIPDAVQIVSEKSISASLAAHPAEFALAIQKATTDRLDALYPNHPFLIRSVTITNFVLPDSIQQQIADKTTLDAKLLTIAAEKRVVEAQQIVTQEKAIVSASALAEAAHNTGLSVDQIIAWERVQALKDIAKQKDKPSVTVLDR